MRTNHRRLDRDQALEIGLTALTFLSDERDRLVRFIELTGIDPSELRAQVQSPTTAPSLLAGVLEHMLADEALLLVFTATARLDPETVGPARDLLRGLAE